MSEHFSYKTIDGRAQAEITEKKSRFICQLAHVETEDEALCFLEEIRKQHAQARHNVYAYIVRANSASSLTDGVAPSTAASSSVPAPAASTTTAPPRIRYSDDGEPAKTAGIPTLETLQHAGLENVAAVVTRYFGGTLLGTGGLVRAYTQATQAAIEEASKNSLIVEISLCVDISVELSYSLYEQAQKLARAASAKIIQEDFAENVSLVFRVLNGCEDQLIEKLTELSSGQAQIMKSAPKYAPM